MVREIYSFHQLWCLNKDQTGANGDIMEPRSPHRQVKKIQKFLISLLHTSKNDLPLPFCLAKMFCVEIWESLIKLVFFKYLFTLLPRSKWKLLALHWYSRRVLPTPPCSFSFFFLSCFPFALPYALMQFHCQLLTRYHFHSQLTNNYYHHCQHIYPPIGWLGKTINNGSQRLKTNHFFHQSCKRMLLSDNHQCYHQD